MMIHCSSIEEMVEVIAGLVAKGLTFEADAARCRITLTGGF